MKTPSEKVECVGVGNRHPDSGEMYCKKCGSNTLSEKVEFNDYMDQAFHDHVQKFPGAENTEFESGWDMAQEYAEKFISTHNKQLYQELEKMKPERFKWDYKEGEGEFKDGQEDIISKAKELLGGTHD